MSKENKKALCSSTTFSISLLSSYNTIYNLVPGLSGLSPLSTTYLPVTLEVNKMSYLYNFWLTSSRYFFQMLLNGTHSDTEIKTIPSAILKPANE